MAFLGRRMRYVWEVCHFEWPSAFSARTLSGPLPFTIHVLLESVDNATELTLVVDAELRGVYKLMEPLMKWVVQGQFKTQLRTLKNLLESGTADNARAG